MHIDLEEDWYGWRLRGRHLVSPDGDRLTPERLKGIVWRESMELRRAGFASRRKADAGRKDGQLVKVVVIALGEYRLRGIGAA